MINLNQIIKFFKDYKNAKMVRKLIYNQAVGFEVNGLNKKINPLVKKEVNNAINIQKEQAEIDKFYDSYTEERINDIHSRGMITPAEKLAEWEKMDLCAPGDAIGSAADRCHYFANQCGSSSRCHECHYDEYSKFEFKLVNFNVNDLSAEIKVKTKKPTI